MLGVAYERSAHESFEKSEFIFGKGLDEKELVKHRKFIERLGQLAAPKDDLIVEALSSFSYLLPAAGIHLSHLFTSNQETHSVLKGSNPFYCLTCAFLIFLQYR